MTGFKSFGEKTVSIKLAPGFTCIIGPNGAGKSNVIDALCFALGRASKKTMRAKALKDLIFAGTKSLKPATSATVKLYFDNSNNEFPYDADEIEVARIVKVKGGSKFMLNGTTTTREQILNVLAQANIDPDGSNQFVLQGKIVELTHMNVIDRRKFIETLIGLEKYDSMKESTFKELEKADRDLGKFEAIFKEVTSQLKKYEKEKNDALRWKELDDKLKSLNAELIALKIEKLRNEEKELETKIDEITVLIKDLEQKRDRQKEKIEQENLVMSQLEERLGEKNSERESIEEELSVLKSELSAKETEIKLAKDSITKLEERKEKLINQQEPLEANQTYDELIDLCKKDIDDLKNQIKENQALEDETYTAIKEKEAEISVIDEEKNNIKSEISNLKQEISSNNAEVKMLKENIKKYKETLKETEGELKSLKKGKDSIEEAVQAVQGELNTIDQRIQDLKKNIDAELAKQKDLENSISEEEEKKSNIEQNISEFQAKISSLQAEIRMHNERVSNLETKSSQLKEDYKRISGGEKVEDAYRTLQEREAECRTDIADLKKKIENLNEQQKKDENEKDQIELKRRSLENEVTDHKTWISGVQTEINLNQRNLKNLQRDRATSELSLNSIKSEISKLTDQLKNATKNAESTQKRITNLQNERAIVAANVKNAEEEYENSKVEVDSILQILTLLTQSIDGAVGEIKSDIQNASETSLNSSITNFRDLFDDIMEIIKPLEELGDIEASKIKDEINPMMETIKLFTENVDDSLRTMIGDVREANDIAVQQSTKNFDRLIADFIDIIEDTNISLKKLTMGKASELHNQLEEINVDLHNYTNKYAEETGEISKFEAQLKAKQNEFDSLSKSHENLLNQIEQVESKLTQLEKDYKEKETQLQDAIKKIEDIDASKTKESTESYWKKQKEFNQQLDGKINDLTVVQNDIRELRDIQRYLDEIDEIASEITSTQDEITEREKQIETENKSIESLRSDLSKIGQHIVKLKEMRDEFWEIREKIDADIEKETEIRNETLERMRGLQNVKRLMDEIERLGKEIEEANSRIDEIKNKNSIVNEEIDQFSEQIKEKEQNLAELKQEKDTFHQNLKEFSKIINEINADSQAKQNRLNDLSQMKNREIEIQQIVDEIDEIDVSIGEMDTEIQELYQKVSDKEEERNLKIEEITKITSERDASWEQQKQLRDELGEITAQLSKESANLETSKNIQAGITDKIEELFVQSKEFGSIPPVPAKETVDTITAKIQKTKTEKTALEPVNLKAIEYYDEVRERFDEIDMRRQTLQRERKAILDSIERIELEKTRTFMKAYHEINRHFSGTFQKLSPGGSAKMILERPDKPFEGGIQIEARPRGKKISSLDILSGGEKTLVALSFIFAVQTQFPAPFYVMDEIDAALDGPNVHRVSTVIKEFADQSQFLVISHREENIMNSEMIYGVSQTDGLTSIFSVDLGKEKERIEQT
jgi:chromosome segregation protein